MTDTLFLNINGTYSAPPGTGGGGAGATGATGSAGTNGTNGATGPAGPTGAAGTGGGAITFTDGITAAGATQGGATALAADLNRVTTVASGEGVRLTPTTVGRTRTAYNRGVNGLLVYPETGSQIEALGANAPVTVAPQGEASFLYVDATHWMSVS